MSLTWLCKQWQHSVPGTRLNDYSFSRLNEHSVHILSFDRNFRFLSGILMLKMLNFDAQYIGLLLLLLKNANK